MRPWKMREGTCPVLTPLTWIDMHCHKSSLTSPDFFPTMTPYMRDVAPQDIWRPNLRTSYGPSPRRADISRSPRAHCIAIFRTIDCPHSNWAKNGASYDPTSNDGFEIVAVPQRAPERRLR